MIAERLSDARIMARFISKFTPGDGCWEWRGTVTTAGYGSFCVDGWPYLAHRLSYERFVGPIANGLHLDHLCRNTICINPKHLEPVTARVNTLRGVGPSARNAVKTHCKDGHEFNEENTYVCKRGKRYCRPCRLKTQRRYLAKQGAA